MRWLAATIGAAAVVAVSLLAAAPAATAALVCPDGYTLNGTVCESIVPATEVPGAWVCPGGFTPDALPVTEDTTCSMQDGTRWEFAEATATTVYSCPRHWTLNASNACERDLDAVACWLAGGTRKDGMCVKPAQTDVDYTCDTGWIGPYQQHRAKVTCDDDTWMCKREVPVYVFEDPYQEPSTWTCPEGYDPMNGVDARTERVAPLCIATTDPTDDTPTGVVYTQSANAQGEVDFCAADGVTTVTVEYSGTGTASSTASDAEALFLAQQKADAAAQADLAAKTPEGATLGACGVAAVAPVLPAVVVEPAPATVAAPAAATVPASVPAGDGSGIPATPVWLLVLLTLGTAAVVASGARLAKVQQR